MSYKSTHYALDDTWTFDYETFYDDDYSLRKMSMEEYIRDERFVCHGLSVKRADRPSIWIAGHARVQRFLDSLDLSGKVIVGQNAKFDGLITHEVFGIKGVVWRDTASMAPAIFGNTLKSQALWYMAKQHLPKSLHKDKAALVDVKGLRVLTDDQMAALGVYAARDTDSTWELYKIYLRTLEQYPLEMGLIEMTMAMFTDPRLCLDPLILDTLHRKEVEEKQVMLDACVADNFKQIRSNQQFADLLTTIGVEVPTKISETTGKETFAFAKTDKEFMDMQMHEDPVVAQLVRSRLRIKSSIEETRAKSYLAVALRGTWPVDLNVSGARTTHRLSGGPGGGGNPQNLGKKSPLRTAIHPPEGYQMAVCDSANIELRGAMMLAGEHEVIERMGDPDFDLYRTFAAHIYNVELSDVTVVQRTVGKVACLSLQYGSGAERFRWTAFNWGVELPMEECERIVDMYRKAFGHITRAWTAWGYVLSKLNRGEVEETWMGHIARASLRTIAGCPGINLAEGPPITYPNLRQEYDVAKGRRQFVYDTWTRGRGSPIRKTSSLWGSKIFQHICQATARSIVMGQVLETDRYLKLEVSRRCQTVMTIHDEGVVIIPRVSMRDGVAERIRSIYCTAPDWWPGLPLGCDLDMDADSYGSART